jgi:CheY-like chemotaxis protein
MLKIAVIDEDAAMRALIGEWVGDEGHEVVALASPDAGAPSGCQLVILDLVNLRSRGAEAVRAARQRFPGAALLGMSTQLGQSLGGCAQAARELGLVGLLAKPCTREELVAALAQVGPACQR